MRFLEIFKDDNSWNEKTIIGFMSFAVMVMVMVADVVSGFIRDYHAWVIRNRWAREVRK